MDSMWLSHFRSWENVVPRNLNDYSAVTVLFMMVSGGESRGFLLKSTIISTVLSVLSSRLLRLHQTASSLTSLSVSRLVTVLNEADQCGVVCNLQELDGGVFRCAVFVYREKSSGERTQPWGAPVLIVWVLDENFPSITTCCLSIRKLVIHWQTEVGTESCVSLFWRVWRDEVLKAELKSTNRILTRVPGLSRCCRMKCSPMLTASSTDLFAL